ncbi:MAG: hypothetical protein AAF850_05095, partial [Pseudomonadota bacterium]
MSSNALVLKSFDETVDAFDAVDAFAHQQAVSEAYEEGREAGLSEAKSAYDVELSSLRAAITELDQKAVALIKSIEPRLHSEVAKGLGRVLSATLPTLAESQLLVELSETLSSFDELQQDPAVKVVVAPDQYE